MEQFMFANMDNTTKTSIAYFSLGDYIVFATVLAISALIGIYFGCFGNKQNTPNEYLFGGKTMQFVPIGFSLAASAISGTNLIGIPAEVYTENISFAFIIPALLLTYICLYFLILPVYCNLKVTSLYEYLEMRFDKKLRLYASFLFILNAMFFLPPILYIPSISLSQVTGVDLYFITTLVAIICIFYTTIGGIKGVVWTDFFQTVVMLFACVLIIILGTYNSGGVSHVFNVAKEGGKLDIFNLDPNPFQRNTFWTIIIGGTFHWTSGLTTSQISFQRFIAVPTIKDAQKALLLFVFITCLITIFSLYGGLLVYAAYLGCDPVEQQIVKKPDQIYVYYALDKLGFIPILPGIFVAATFCGALSSMSTFLNGIAGAIYEDFIKSKNVSDKKAQIIMKSIVVIVGIFAVSTTFVVEKLGNILAVMYTLGSVTGGPVFTLFALGMFFPHSNWKGSLIGSLTCFLLLGWIAIGAAMNNVTNGSTNVYSNFPNTCLISNNSTMEILYQQNVTQSVEVNEDDVFILYKLSYMVFKFFGVSVGILVGIIASYLTGPTDISILDKNLISPPLRKFLPQKVENSFKIEVISKN